MLRPYQRRAIDEVNKWIASNRGNPCLVLPTGSGKSHIIAAMCKEYVSTWPETRVLVLTHVKELIEQGIEKMRQHWPAAPMGVYSASIGKRQLGEPITFAGIQSIANRADDVGHIDLVIVDECDLIGHKDEGRYRTFLGRLKEINPNMVVIGLTATPYRLGHGMITDEPALFHALIEPVDVVELLALGHLCPLRLKKTQHTYDTSSVHKRGGEYIESELQKVVDTDEQTQKVVDEILANGDGRKSWVLFCTGIDHSHHVAEALRARGVTCETVSGDTPKGERERILADFKLGKVTALTNANVLTTGFDHPPTDLIGFLRPTASTRLMIQMAGRGMRPSPGKADCLVLDFSGVSKVCGTIVNPTIPTKKGGGTLDGEAPVKVCDVCNELVHLSAKVCPACGAAFPESKKAAEPIDVRLVDGDIMGLSVNPDDLRDVEVSSWRWQIRRSQKTGKEQIALTYYGKAISDRPVTEYLCVFHEGYAGQKAWTTVTSIAQRCGKMPKGILADGDVVALVEAMNAATPPTWIQFERDGNFDRITRRHWG
jgi:DNA repair protein RadD